MNFLSNAQNKNGNPITMPNKHKYRLSLQLVLISAIFAGCSKDKPSAPPDKAPIAEKAEAGGDKVVTLSADEGATSGVHTAVLEQQIFADQLTVTATIEPAQDRYASIAPRISGKVNRVMVGLGEQVRAGQSLALVDSIEAGEAQSAYAQAVTELSVARSAAERAERLQADQIIPQKDVLRAQADLEKAKAIARAAGDRRHALGLNGRDGETSKTPSIFPVTAPFAGTVVDKKAVLGELAQPDKPLFAIADMSHVWIETNLFEKDLARVKPGAQAVVTVAAYGSEAFRGKVTYISSVMDKETRTVKARVEVPNPEGKLKLGMFASAAISTEGSQKSLMLPNEAVVLVQGQPTVFVKRGEGFDTRAVELGDKRQGLVEIKGGVKTGETVVTQGAYALKAKLLKSQISAD
ncbi:cation efflux system protein CzcB [Janthinobacterium sp. HH01]|uniref:efflux RND transporter periplasmic adaptor subunit n=1 Tax=Janthinobacterium sp. HH01 TaxID=1198452 RepID=UPI0002AEDE40|nr:efflux RND transporter periplasmic adaptor subunit [Janthinobacterium sp. HH01]ELX08350.1 cation efflux system protein CzcB [Janthinobacterium sp. HH01]